MKKIQITLLAFAFAILIAIGACVSKPDVLPNFPKTVSWLNRPDSFPSPSLSGKISILGFYTEDCSGCIDIQPTLTKAIQRYGDAVQVIGIYTPLPMQESTIPDIKRLLKDKKTPYPVLLDHDTKILRAFAVTSWPTIIISDSNKQIIHRLHGSKQIINELPGILKKATR